jgi:hypothetical protein
MWNRTPRSYSPSNLSPLQLITGESLDWSATNRFAFGDLLAVTSGNLPADGRSSWKFDTNNELGIYVGNSLDMKRGCRVYYPDARAFYDRFHCWQIHMSDTQLLDFYQKRLQLREYPTAYRQISNALHDFTVVPTADTANPTVHVTASPLSDGDIPLPSQMSEFPLDIYTSNPSSSN